uniref:Uncharacterized protein n=1 Tax=Anopheles coluzzii TaxID=1518534 RepID=A0A8W7PQQ7_ANOCL
MGGVIPKDSRTWRQLATSESIAAGSPRADGEEAGLGDAGFGGASGSGRGDPARSGLWERRAGCWCRLSASCDSEGIGVEAGVDEGVSDEPGCCWSGPNSAGMLPAPFGRNLAASAGLSPPNGDFGPYLPPSLFAAAAPFGTFSDGLFDLLRLLPLPALPGPFPINAPPFWAPSFCSSSFSFSTPTLPWSLSRCARSHLALRKRRLHSGHTSVKSAGPPANPASVDSAPSSPASAAAPFWRGCGSDVAHDAPDLGPVLDLDAVHALHLLVGVIEKLGLRSAYAGAPGGIGTLPPAEPPLPAPPASGPVVGRSGVTKPSRFGLAIPGSPPPCTSTRCCFSMYTFANSLSHCLHVSSASAFGVGTRDPFGPLLLSSASAPCSWIMWACSSFADGDCSRLISTPLAPSIAIEPALLLLPLPAPVSSPPPAAISFRSEEGDAACSAICAPTTSAAVPPMIRFSGLVCRNGAHGWRASSFSSSGVGRMPWRFSLCVRRKYLLQYSLQQISQNASGLTTPRRRSLSAEKFASLAACIEWGDSLRGCGVNVASSCSIV